MSDYITVWSPSRTAPSLCSDYLAHSTLSQVAEDDVKTASRKRKGIKQSRSWHQSRTMQRAKQELQGGPLR